MKKLLNVTTIAELRKLPAANLSWTDDALNDVSFPGYFLDGEILEDQTVVKMAAHAIMPVDPGTRYAAGNLIVDEIMIGFNSKDGTAQYYGTAPFAANSSNGNYSSTMKARSVHWC
jgi:hypothetical protein